MSIDIDVPSMDSRDDNGSMKRDCQSREFQKSERNMQDKMNDCDGSRWNDCAGVGMTLVWDSRRLMYQACGMGQVRWESGINGHHGMGFEWELRWE